MQFWVLAISSALLYGVWKFGLSAFRGTVSAYAAILISASTALLVYLVVGSARNVLDFNVHDVPAGLLGGALNFTGTLLIFKAFTRGKVGVAVGVGALNILVPLSYALLRGERPDVHVAFGVALLLAGLCVFYAPNVRTKDPDDAAGSRTTILLALGAALAWGLAIIVLDVGAQPDVVTSTLAVSQIPQIAIATIVLIAASRHSIRGVSRTAFAALAGSGAALGVANMAFFTAANEGSLGIVSVLTSASPLVTAVLAAVFLAERLTNSDRVAFALVIVGSALVVV